MSEMPVKQRHPALIVLRALLAGHPVQMDGEEYRYVDGVFGVKRERSSTQTPGEIDEIVLGVDISLPAFIRMCERLPEESVIQVVFQVTMAMERKKRVL